MPRIERTSRANKDAVEIWAYIADDNNEAADRLLHQIDDRIRNLSRMPASAKATPHMGKGLRRSSVGRYMIYYRPIPDGIQVLRILHGARQPEDLV